MKFLSLSCNSRDIFYVFCVRREGLIPWLKNVSLFAGLSEETIDDISQISELKTYDSDETIFKEGDVADYMYVIISGQILIEREFKEQKRKKTLAILEGGDFFGEMGMVTNDLRSASAMTSENSVLIRLAKSHFLQKIKKNPDLCFEMLQVVCRRLKAADDEIEHLAFQNLPGRIASKIIELADQFGEKRDGFIDIKLSLTHSSLAEMVGTNRETISKYMSIFKKEGSIDYSDQKVSIVNKAKLLSWS